jgi:hypothetical protein
MAWYTVKHMNNQLCLMRLENFVLDGRQRRVNRGNDLGMTLNGDGSGGGAYSCCACNLVLCKSSESQSRSQGLVPAILTEVIRDFPQPPQKNAESVCSYVTITSSHTLIYSRFLSILTAIDGR